MITQAEQDKEIAKLYLARSEGKVIQIKCTSGVWVDIGPDEFIKYGMRIKPQTVEEAARAFITNTYNRLLFSSDFSFAVDGFHAGVKWRDENPKEQDNEN